MNAPVNQNTTVSNTAHDHIGGNSPKAVTQVPNLVSVGQISPPQSDFIRPVPAPRTPPTARG